MRLVLLLLAGCASANGWRGTGGGTHDTSPNAIGATAGSGGGGGGGTDTGASSETGLVADTSGCRADDLTVTVEARDSTGSVSTYFSSGTAVTLATVFTNGCADDIGVQLQSACFVSAWSLVGDTGTNVTSTTSCASASTTVAPGATVEVTYAAGALALGNYTVTATSGVTGQAFQTSFTVQ